jgi:hypothetical protein
MKFVLNGCSFCANYHLAGDLAKELGYTDFVNLSIGGSSNRRILRSTLEYVERYGADFVLLGLTFWDRQEAPFKQVPAHDDPWVSYNPQGLQGLFAPEGTKFNNNVSRTELQNFIAQRYVYDISVSYVDQLLCDITMFASYLKQKQIRFLIFNTCELDYELYFKSVNSTYQTTIAGIKEVIPLSFTSNIYLANLNASYSENERRWPAHARHYDSSEYRHLNEYLLQYINDRDI